jgi:hypothetical protein
MLNDEVIEMVGIVISSPLDYWFLTPGGEASRSSTNITQHTQQAKNIIFFNMMLQQL